MKTNRSQTMVRNPFLALASALVFAGLAGAQSGKFTLPFEARWGVATSPAGDYQFTMDSVKSPTMIEVFRGTKGGALITASQRNSVSVGSAALTIGRTSDENAVRDLTFRLWERPELLEVGVALHYAVPKARRASVARERDTAQVISVPVTHLLPLLGGERVASIGRLNRRTTRTAALEAQALARCSAPARELEVPLIQFRFVFRLNRRMAGLRTAARRTSKAGSNRPTED